ncbi:MAG TPA: hypothetical protein PKN33_13020 [Phycisphaerae bacterium]|nr:hypothetical protein [Phycisphaerae bacterium]
MFPVVNPKRVFVFWGLFFIYFFGHVIDLPRIGNLPNLTAGEKFEAFVNVALLVALIVVSWKFITRYRRGYKVAVTSDGLFLHLPGCSDNLIPWNGVGRASVKPVSEGKPQMATLLLRKQKMYIDIGGAANVFPKRADVELFVRLVREHIESQGKSAASASEVK